MTKRDNERLKKLIDRRRKTEDTLVKYELILEDIQEKIDKLKEKGAVA